MISDEVALELSAVRKTFGELTAVAGVTQAFGRGEYFCILGPSGCGKTTLLRLVAGFDTPDSGTIRLNGRDVVALPPERRDVNVVFQSYALFPHLDVKDNIAFGLRMKRTAEEVVRERVQTMLRLMRLEQESDRRPHQLSGGQQQRVALARALVNRPAVLFLDEPLGALDESLRADMQIELRKLQRETHVTFIHITHDQQEALALADRIGVMRAGQFEQVGTPRDVYERPSSPFVATFVGATNLIDGELVDAAHVRLFGEVLTLPAAVTQFAPGTPVVIAVRPATIRVGAAGAAGGVRARIIATAFAGAFIDVTAALPDGTHVHVHVPAGVEVPADTDISLHIDPRAATVLPRHSRTS